MQQQQHLTIGLYRAETSIATSREATSHHLGSSAMTPLNRYEVHTSTVPKTTMYCWLCCRCVWLDSLPDVAASSSKYSTSTIRDIAGALSSISNLLLVQCSCWRQPTTSREAGLIISGFTALCVQSHSHQGGSKRCSIQKKNSKYCRCCFSVVI